MNKNLFKKFFQDYSKNVDNANSQFFWRLSDDIILSIIAKYIKNSSAKNSTILDAGGGTGRWVGMMSQKYKSKLILYDLSEDMLNVARNKKSLRDIGDRLEIIQGDIQDMSKVESSSVDYITSIYNPVSFVKSPILFFKEVKRILKRGGIAMIMGQGFTNAIASKINNYLADAKELAVLAKNEKVKWSSNLAPLHVFSKQSIENLAFKAGLKIVKTYGVPVFLQPGPEDFDSQNKQRSRVSTKLESDKTFYKAVYDLEMKHNANGSMVNRGMNLMLVVRK
jgi:ubiquinone/menaquinone biosynthesis C-methylase UbiE